MTVYVADSILDGGHDELILKADAVYLTQTFSTVYATVIAGAMGTFVPAITKADRTGGGRSSVLAAALGVDITIASGTELLNNIVVVDSVNSVVLISTESDGKTFNDTDKANVPQTEIYQISDAVIAP